MNGPPASAKWARALVCAAAAAPCLVVLGLFATSGAATLLGRQPLIWGPPREVTLSEAVVLRDRGETLMQLMLGTNPNRAYDVIDVLRESEHVMLTPLEAAVIGRELDLVDVLVEWGAIVDERNVLTLTCLAHAVKAQASIVERLAEQSPQTGSCEAVVLPYQP